MAARWEAWGLDRLDAAARRDRPRTRGSIVVRSELPDRRRAIGWPTSQTLIRRCRAAASGSEETADDPGRALADLARVGYGRSRSPPGLEELTWFGSGPHETYPGPEARRGSSAAGTSTVDRPVRAVHPAAGERRPRRRPLAGARRGRRARAAAPDRPRPAAPGLGDATSAPRTWRRATPRRGARPAAGDDHPLDAAHRGLGHRQLRPGHAAGVPRRARHVPLVLDAPSRYPATRA